MMGSSGMMGGQLMGFGILGWLINLIVIGAVVYIAVRMAIKHERK
ncbi:hypothetical protein GCM10008967_21500 [Bacillus carboniphilus]|uniref:Uncharacterized protein n=1 Tax=Bacillus carboniphilus TaxID=86663 RepID=A0ABP3FZ55_9BACI